MPVELRWGAASHVGCVRSANQDAVLAGPVVFAVADGMGGHAAGEVASAIALARLARLPVAPSGDAVIAAVQEANAEVIAHGEVTAGREGMGTTLSALVVAEADGEPQLLVVNIGDSRTYRLDAEALTQVTADHSVVADMVRAGELSADEASRHPSRNVVTRALGIEREVIVDHWWVPPVPGQVFLMCSDGLTNEVPVARLEEVLVSRLEPQATVDLLVAEALDAGARDNVSAVVVAVDALSHERYDDEITLRRRRTAPDPLSEAPSVG